MSAKLEFLVEIDPINHHPELLYSVQTQHGGVAERLGAPVLKMQLIQRTIREAYLDRSMQQCLSNDRLMTLGVRFEVKASRIVSHET